MTVALGFFQHRALEPLYEYGSPVWIKPAEDGEGIVPCWVTYFDKDEITRITAYLTMEGDLVERLERIADELEGAGWPAVAEDVRDGVPLETIERRLRDIGEGDSEAVEIITYEP